jgi:hypothetical protein
MSKDQDSLAPTGYADEQLKAIRRMPRIINQLLDGHDQDPSNAEGASEDWNPAIPQYVFPERARSPRRWRMT